MTGLPIGYFGLVHYDVIYEVTMFFIGKNDSNLIETLISSVLKKNIMANIGMLKI